MKNGFLLLLFQFLCLSIFSQHSYGDTLSVMSYNGVNLRTGPFTSSPKYQSVPYGTKFIFCNQYGDDQIEARFANWIEVEYNGLALFVFDGFLSDYTIPHSKNIDPKDFDQYIREIYGVELIDSIEYVDKSSASVNPSYDPSKYNLIYEYESGLQRRRIKSRYGISYEYTFPPMKSKELVNLMDLLYASDHKHTLIDHFENIFGKRLSCPAAFWFYIHDDSKKEKLQYERKNGVQKIYLIGVDF